MDTYSASIRNHQIKTVEQYRNVFLGVTEEIQRSVVEGSPETGAPGQPVDTGQLKSSFIPSFTGIWSWVLSTRKEYAPSIEDGVSYAHGGTPMKLKSAVGGFGSVKLTIAGFQRIVDSVVARVAK